MFPYKIYLVHKLSDDKEGKIQFAAWVEGKDYIRFNTWISARLIFILKGLRTNRIWHCEGWNLLRTPMKTAVTEGRSSSGLACPAKA
jgi:hypothetical protein